VQTRLQGAGHAVFAVAVAGLGALGFVWKELPYVWQPAPTWLPGSSGIAYAASGLWLLCGMGLLWPKALPHAARLLIAIAATSMLVIHAPRMVRDPLNELEWFNLGELAALVAGAWILLTGAGPESARRWGRGRVLFALALPAFGLSHFLFAEATVGFVPAWLPGRLAWAYLTGGAHIAAGLGLLLGVLPRLAATLEAWMLGVFVLMVNAPDLVRGEKPPEGVWTEFFVAAAICGTAFLVARTYRGERWIRWR